MTETLLILHILGAALWLGASTYNWFLGPRFVADGGPAVGAWVRIVGEASTRFFMPAAILTLLTGIGLVATNEAWGWGDVFVTVGFVVVIAGALIASFILSPATKDALSAMESGDFPAAATAGRRSAMWGRVITALLVVALIFMVLKTGAG